MTRRLRAVHPFLLSGLVLCLGCSGASTPNGAAPAETRRPVAFSLVSLSGQTVDSGSVRGRPTVIFLFTSYDVTSLMLASQVETLRQTHRPRINVVGVAIEPPRNAMLVEAYVESLGLGFPVAMADHAMQEGRGPFGSLQVVPVVIVLDRAGRPVWRGVGPVSLAEMEQALAKASPGRDAPPETEVTDP